MKKQIKTGTSVVLLVVMMCTLCACQPAPEKEAVTSKNNGLFEERINNTEATKENTESSEINTMRYSDKFSSTDGSVNFTVDIHENISTDVGKVIEVIPHRLTEEDIKRVATVLLGDVEFYERQLSTKQTYSKSQYQTKINRFASYATEDALNELMGVGGASLYLEYIQDYIGGWTASYETAPESDPRQPCDWTLKKERSYNNSSVEVGGRMIDEDCDVLYANAEKDGIVYTYYVRTHDSDQYKVNYITLDLSEGIGPFPIEQAIYKSQLCRTEKPTDQQIENLKEETENALTEMKLGQWKIVDTTVNEVLIGDALEYTVSISAVPVLNGLPTLYGQKIGNKENSYNSEYPMTEALFEYAANGEIVSFSLNSPVDIVTTKNNNVETLSLDELFEKFVNHLTLSDANAYGLPIVDRRSIEKATNEKLICNVNISKAEYCLGRVAIPERDNTYYYIPVLAFNGYTNYVGENSHEVRFGDTDISEANTSNILCINAVDGSIIK